MELFVGLLTGIVILIGLALAVVAFILVLAGLCWLFGTEEGLGCIALMIFLGIIGFILYLLWHFIFIDASELGRSVIARFHV